MGVVFQPADPVGEQIAAQYAAQQQFNQSAPLRAQMANQNANRDQQNLLAQMQMDSANQRQSSENITRASIAGDEMANRRYLQDQDIRGARQAQLQQIQAHQQSQLLDAAMYEQKVTQAEAMRMQRQQTALDSIQQAISSGQLMPEEAQEMQMQLLTGINMTQQRMQRDHAKDFAAQAKLREEQAKVAALNTETIKGLSLKSAQGQMSTGMLINPITGTPHWVKVDDKGNIVPVEEPKAGEGSEQKPAEGNKWGHLAMKGTNKLDEAKVMKDAEAYAKFHEPPVYVDQKDASGNTKRVIDKEQTDANIRSLAQRRAEGIRREFDEAEGGPQKRAAEQEQQVVRSVDQWLSKPKPDMLKSGGANPEIDRRLVLGWYAEIQKLMSNPAVTSEDIAEAKRMKEQIKTIRERYQ